MKFRLAIVVFTFGLLNCSNPNDEADVIRKLVESEDIAFSTSEDRLAWAGYWDISANSRWWYTAPDFHEYWNEADFKTAIATKNMPPLMNGQNTFSDFVIKVNGVIAWVTYDRKEVIEGKPVFTHEVRLLEKIN